MNKWSFLVSGILAPVFIIFLSGCDSATLAAMDEAVVGMGGERTCTRYADGGYKTISGKGYTFTYGGHCNYWEGELHNWSEYEIRCTARAYSGHSLNSVYADPGEDTGMVSLGSMSGTGGGIEVSCGPWSRRAQVKRSHDRFDLETRLSRGDEYVRLKNTSDYSLRCTIHDKEDGVEILNQQVAAGSASSWRETPDRYSYRCSY